MEKREKQQQYWFVIQQLTSRELKRKYARSVLGVLWSVLNPKRGSHPAGNRTG